MIAIGIALGILAYATIYSGVMGITGRAVGIIESMTPGFQPPPLPLSAAAGGGGKFSGGGGKGKGGGGGGGGGGAG